MRMGIFWEFYWGVMANARDKRDAGRLASDRIRTPNPACGIFRSGHLQIRFGGQDAEQREGHHLRPAIGGRRRSWGRVELGPRVRRRIAAGWWNRRPGHERNYNMGCGVASKKQ